MLTLTTTNVLFKKQKAAVRIFSQVKYSTHTLPLFKSLEILPLPSLISYFKIQFMQQYKRGLLPASFNNILVTKEAHHAQPRQWFYVMTQNFIPASRLTQCSFLPYYSLPRIWSEFDQLNPAISILRDKKEFNKELKIYFINKLSSTIKCNRLLCPSCSSFIAYN
jgi:hypothetical protein